MIKKSIKDYDFTDEKFNHHKKEIIKEPKIIFYDDELDQISDYTTMINHYTIFGTIIYCYIVHTYIETFYKN